MMISNKRGFTLIELLVVVLIIGVLAAVALPQYQTAINKSRYAGLMPLAKAVKDAEEEVFMTKADYTAVLGDLSVMPGTIDEDHPNTATNGNVTLSVVAGASEGQDYVKAVDNRNADNTFIMYFARSPKYAGEIHCEAKTSNAKAQQLCKSYGPVGTITNGADTTGTFTTYVLQGTGQNAGPDCGTSGCWKETAFSNEVMQYLMNHVWYVDDEDAVIFTGVNDGWYSFLDSDDSYYYNPELNVAGYDELIYFLDETGQSKGYGICDDVNPPPCTAWSCESGECLFSPH